MWSVSTLNELAGLIPIFDHSILQKIPKVGCSQGCEEFGKHSEVLQYSRNMTGVVDCGCSCFH